MIVFQRPLHVGWSGLDKKSEGYKEKIHILNGNKEYLEKQIKEQENNLRELITTKKNAS